jgi:hypothetical protein
MPTHFPRQILLQALRRIAWPAAIASMFVVFGYQGAAAGENANDPWQGARIFYLSFDGSFEAAESGGNPQPEVRGKPVFVEGKKGQAASFTDAANLVFNAEGNFDQSEGSVAMWVQPYWPNSDGIPHCFLEVPVGPELFTDGGFVMTKGWSTGVMPNLSYWYNSPGHYHMSGGNDFEANEWVHITFTWSLKRKLLQLFWNGELVQTQKYEVMQERPSSAGRVLVVGARLGGRSIEETEKGDFYGHLPRRFSETGGDSVDAALDELMIFNRALTLEEAAGLAGTTPKVADDVDPLDPAHVNRLEARLETPHIQFARRLASGPVKALFVCPVQLSGACRDVVELAQRFDVEFSAVTTWYPWTLGYDREYFRMWKDTSTAEKVAEIQARLSEEPEVLVLANVIYTKLPQHLHNVILQRVRNGMGLVVPGPRRLHADFQPDAASADGSDGRVAGAGEQILAGVPLAGLPEFFPGTEKSPAERAENSVRAYKVGSGRVVVIRWSDQEAEEGEGFEGLAPVASGGRWTRQYEHRYNYHIGLVGKALLWAAGREMQAEWSELPPEGQTLQRAELPMELPVGVNWSGAEGTPAMLQATLRDPLGQVELEEAHAVTLVPGANAIPLDIPRLKHGLHFLDLVLTTDAGVENWATVSFLVDGPGRIAAVTTEKEHYERGETVRATVQFNQDVPERAELRIRARDTNGRIYHEITISDVPGAAEVGFEIPVDRPTTLASHIEVELWEGDEVISFGDAIVFVPKRDFTDFLSVLWCTIANPGVGQVALRQARELGFDAVYHWGNQCGDFQNDAMADLMPVQYCTRITLAPDARGWPTGIPGDGRLDPKRKVFLEKFKEDVQASMPLGPPYYSLGDENSFQFGIGYSPYELKAYRQFLQQRYGTIARLNEEYGAEYAGFADVPRYAEADAIDEDVIPALIDHRMGTEDEYARYHHEMVQAIRELDPHARVGAEGSEAGDMERMLDGVQMWGPYGDDVLLRSLAPPDLLASHWWAGLSYGPEDCTKLWTWLIRGFINYHQFFCALHIDGALFNVDYSLRPFFENFLPEWREIHSGTALMLRDAEVTSQYPIAVHWSRESEHASFALKTLGTTESSRNTLVKTMDALSRDYRYVSSRQIVDGKLIAPEAGILFLPASHCLNEATAEGIIEYVRGGGTVVADFLPALNEFGRRLPEGRLDEMFGATCAGKTTPVAVSDLRLDVALDGTPLRLTCPRTIAHADARVQGARVLVADRDIPMMLVNEVGRGRAILLNFDLSRCSRDQRRGFVSSLLQVAGAEPVYRMVEGPPETQVSVLRRGEVTLIGVVLPEDAAEGVRLTWDEPTQLYDVRAGAHLGEQTGLSIPLSDPLRAVHLFALQRSAVSEVTLESSPAIVRGETLAVNVGVGFEDPGQTSSDRLVRVDVADPQGRVIRHYRKFVRLSGPDGAAEIPFAYNDLPGEWRITATDIATGRAGNATVVLHD